jgi:hypothetical protein
MFAGPYMKKAVKNEAKHNRIGAFVLLLSLLFLFATTPLGVSGEPPTPREVWARAESLGARHDLDPLLLYAIACAESSLNPDADSGAARGLMQMSPQAWKDVTDRSYRDAWDWRANMDAAGAYLAILRTRLAKSGHLSSANLVAAYHFGPGRLEKAGYDLSRLPRVQNLVYGDILAGRVPNLPAPAPERLVLRSWRGSPAAPTFEPAMKPLFIAPLLVAEASADGGAVSARENQAAEPRELSLAAVPELNLPVLHPATAPDALDFGPLLVRENDGTTPLLFPALDPPAEETATGEGTEGDLFVLPVLSSDSPLVDSGNAGGTVPANGKDDKETPADDEGEAPLPVLNLQDFTP